MSGELKCKCGNELGKPLVSPTPMSFTDEKTKQVVWLLFMAGFNQHGECWFCAFPRFTRELNGRT